MKKKRILLFSAKKLLGESLEQTLQQMEGIEIAGHWPVDDQVLERLACAQADLIILTDEGSSKAQLFQLTAHILDQYPDLPVFRVTLERNQMQVFSSHLIQARSADFIDLIQHLPLKWAGIE